MLLEDCEYIFLVLDIMLGQVGGGGCAGGAASLANLTVMIWSYTVVAQLKVVMGGSLLGCFCRLISNFNSVNVKLTSFAYLPMALRSCAFGTIAW